MQTLDKRAGSHSNAVSRQPSRRFTIDHWRLFNLFNLFNPTHVS